MGDGRTAPPRERGSVERSVRRGAANGPSARAATVVPRRVRRGAIRLNTPRARRREIPNGGPAQGVHWRSARGEKARHRPSAARPGPMGQARPAKRAAIGGEGSPTASDGPQWASIRACPARVHWARGSVRARSPLTIGSPLASNGLSAAASTIAPLDPTGKALARGPSAPRGGPAPRAAAAENTGQWPRYGHVRSNTPSCNHKGSSIVNDIAWYCVAIDAGFPRSQVRGRWSRAHEGGHAGADVRPTGPARRDV